MSLRPFLVSLFAFASLVLRAQNNWQAEVQTVTRENLWGIAFSGSALVAVGENGTLLYSDYDGASWQPRPSGTDVWLVGVGHGNNRWIVVGDRGTILVSDDNGDTWNPRPSGTNARINNVIYGNGRWLAVGEQGVVLTSPDGNTWTARAVAETGFLRALAFGQGQFLFGGANGVLYTTTDGATFTRVPIATTANIEAVAITSTRYFASGSEGLWATTSSLTANNWAINIAPNHGTFRGLVARSPEDASIASDVSALGFNAGLWSASYLRPAFLVTEMTLGRDEAIAVGFGGGIARSSSLYNVAIVPRGDNVSAPINNAASATYGTEVRLAAVSTGAATNVAFQWQRDGNDIPGATGAELVLPAVKPPVTAAYAVRAQAGSTTVRSPGLTLNVVPAGRPSAIDPGFNFALSTPTALRVQPDGKILALGYFNGGIQPTLARVNRDGSRDETFSVNLSGALSAFPAILPDGKIYLQGPTAVDGQAVPRLARLTSTGALDRSFAPDPTDEFRTLVAAPNGSVYTISKKADAAVRLTSTGARDATFAALPAGYSPTALDGESRLLANAPLTYQPQLWTYPGLIHRFLSNGTRDASFELNFGNRTLGAVAGNIVYGHSALYGRFGASRSYFRTTAAGATDETYSPPPGTIYPDFNLEWSVLYASDGGLWDFRRDQGYQMPMRARYYGPSGALDPTHRIELTDAYTYVPFAIEADGSVLAWRRSSYFTATGSPSGPSIVRLRSTDSTRVRLGNLSVRSFVASADSPLIAGFVTSGSGETRAVVRAVGPGLVPFGVNDAMTDPQLRIVADNTTVATNDQWSSTLAARFSALGAFALPAGSNDAALEAAIGAGNYSAVVTPAGSSGPGTALVEVYESADNAPRRFINLSARGPVAPGRPLIVGFTVSGDSSLKVLVRGVGPTLAQLGVGGTLANPRITLYRSDATLYDNDDWSKLNGTLSTSTAGTGAFPLASASNDAAMLVTLSPGSYTAVVEGAAGATGTALAEIYQVP